MTGSRRWAPGAAAWSLLFAATSAYWSAGGTAGAETVGKDLAELATERDPAFVATLWAAAGLKALLAALAFALLRPWGARTGRLVRLAGWAAGIALALYGVLGLTESSLIRLGVLAVPEGVGGEAIGWYVFLWEPLWLLGGVLFIGATRAAPRPTSIAAR